MVFFQTNRNNKKKRKSIKTVKFAINLEKKIFQFFIYFTNTSQAHLYLYVFYICNTRSIFNNVTKYSSITVLHRYLSNSSRITHFFFRKPNSRRRRIRFSFTLALHRLGTHKNTELTESKMALASLATRTGAICVI